MNTRTYALKLVPAGDSLAVILPDDVLKDLGLAEGDALHVSDIPGGLRMTRPHEGSVQDTPLPPTD